MTTQAALIAKTRLELADAGEGFQLVVAGDGRTQRVELPGRKADIAGLLVVLNGVTLAPGIGYQIDPERNSLVLAQPMPLGQHLFVTGTGYRYFSDDEMVVLVTTAFLQHTHNTGQSIASLPPVEEQLVAILAVIEGLYILLTDASMDIDVSTPEGVSIPRAQRHRQLMALIEMRKQQYATLSAALNVGLGRIEMFNLRRVSRTTGRYVPVYLDRELEDNSYPRRVFPPIDTNGGAPALDSVPDSAIRLVQGEPFTMTLQLGLDLTGSTVRVALRRYRNSAAYRYFGTTITTVATGAITATLSGTETRALGGGPFWWDVIVRDSLGTSRTLAEGLVEVEARART